MLRCKYLLFKSFRSFFMALTRSQLDFIAQFKSQVARKDIFMLAGGAGSGKSFVSLLLLHRLALEFAGARFGVFRKSRTTLKTNTIPSFMRVLSETDTHNSLVISDFSAKYKNGSEILFLWLDPAKDPDNNNVKGLELSAALFEEVNQLDKESFHTVRSRVGRWNNLKSVITNECKHFYPFILANCNPNNTWVKHDFYDPFIEGKLPDNVVFHESSSSDNKHLDPSYLEVLASLPDEQKERYLNNNWHYNDNPNALISLEDFMRASA